MGGKGSGRERQHFSCGTVQRYRQHRRIGENCKQCLDAANEYARMRYKSKVRKPKVKNPNKVPKGAINRQMVRQFKLDAGHCMDCNMEVNDRTIVCFDLDHRDPQEKSFTISYMIDRASPNDIRDELQKCDVVCRNCHALRTYDGQHHLVRRDETTTHLSLFD